MVGAQRVRPAHDFVELDQRALLAARAGECEQVGGDPADARRLVVHHLDCFALLRCELIEQQGLCEPRDDGGGIVDLVRYPAHELSQGGELLGLLQLGLGPPLVRDVADERENLRDAPGLAHRREQYLAGPLTAVGPLERHLEAPQLAVKRRREVLPRDAGGGSFQPPEARSLPAGVRFPRERVYERPTGRILVEDVAVTVHHHNRLRDGLHQQTQIALGRCRRSQRAHKRARLVGHFILEDLRVASAHAEGVEHAGGDDRHPDADDDGLVRLRRGVQHGADRHSGHSGQADDRSNEACRGARLGGRRAPALEMLRVVGCDGGGGRDQQQPDVPGEVERSAGLVRAPQRDHGVDLVADHECDHGRQQERRRGGREHRAAQHLHQNHPQHRDGADRPTDARHERGGGDRRAGGQQWLKQILVRKGADRERHEHGIEDELGVGAARGLAAHHGDETGDQARVQPEESHVGQ